MGSILKTYKLGAKFQNDSTFEAVQKLDKQERKKVPKRTEIINYLLKSLQRETTYLEIGVRNPDHNFNQIVSNKKYSVDPGIEFEQNPVDFKMTSDQFFEQLSSGQVLNKEMRFDAIFIDGLHLADQVYRDIQNALMYIKDDGFIVMHDCNPPTEWHARESFEYHFTPARAAWNGTTWKAYYRMRFNDQVSSCCVDTDWGVGIITKRKWFEALKEDTNPFFEFQAMDTNRQTHLNLISFEDLKKLI